MDRLVGEESQNEDSKAEFHKRPDDEVATFCAKLDLEPHYKVFCGYIDCVGPKAKVCYRKCHGRESVYGNLCKSIVL